MGTWFITGCSSGLGKGIATAALRAGENVIMTARNLKKLDELLEEYPDTSYGVYLDLNDVESMDLALSKARERFGDIDVLINNAGHGYRATVEESEVGGIQGVFQSNFFAPAHIMRKALPEMSRKRNGIIVNITSIGAVRGALGNGYYSAAKGALELLTESLSKEVKDLGIRTMLVEPGAFQTNFYGENLSESSTKIKDYEFIARNYRKEYVNPSAEKQGDPEKGGQVIVDVILKNEIPERLLLGSDALSIAKNTYKSKLEELARWEEVSKRSDHTIIHT